MRKKKKHDEERNGSKTESVGEEKKKHGKTY